MASAVGARVIDGKASSKLVTDAVKFSVAQLKEKHGLVPGLATVLVGDNSASKVYVRMKQRMAESLGIHSFQHTLPAEATQEDLLRLVDELNGDERVHGILVQMPLPDHMDELAVISRVVRSKDVDGLHPENAGRMLVGASAMVPCTPMGCVMLLADVVPDFAGKHAVVLGRSNLVGKPLASLLLQENCTVTVAHSRTVDVPAVCRTADILVAAVGRPGLVQRGWIKPGAVVIDVGVNRVPAEEEGKTKLVGDVDYEGVRQVASAITPVPGGVGPMTIACLMANTLKAACLIHGVADISYLGLRLPKQ